MGCEQLPRGQITRDGDTRSPVSACHMPTRLVFLMPEGTPQAPAWHQSAAPFPKTALLLRPVPTPLYRHS